MPGNSATHPTSIIHYIPGGTFAHSVTRFLNATVQAECTSVYDQALVTGRSACQAYVNCVLENLDEYAKAGIGGGTQLLTLIPAALAFFPSRGPTAYAVLRLPNARMITRLSILALGSFSGLLPAGSSFEVAAHAAGMQPNQNGKKGIEDMLEIWDDNLSRSKSSVHRSSRFRWLFVGASLLIALAIIYASIAMGLLGIVTWACDRQMLVMSWVIARMGPTVLEALMLHAIRAWLSRKTRKIGGQAGPSPSHSFIDLPHGLEGTLYALQTLCKSLNYAIAIWGTAVLGSTILVDGIPGMAFLLLLPALYGLMQLCVYRAIRDIT